jgi:hypothetical protein
MRSTARLVTALVALTISGCASQVPHPQRFPSSSQLAPKASKHWEVMADDIATQAKTSLDRVATQKVPIVYVVQSRQRSVFSQAFHDFLITRLVHHGIAVSQRSQGAIRLEYQSRLVRHGSEREIYYPGTLTALTAGLLVARNIAEHGISPLGFAALGIGADIAASVLDATQASKLELIVTTSIVDNGRYIMRKSDVYYLNEADSALFTEPRTVPTRQYRVLGAGR